MRYLVLIICFVLSSCTFRVETDFSKEALEEQFYTLDNKKITFEKILEKYKGQKIVIDVWASWCSDCLESLPTIKSIQRKHPNVVFLFLSIDYTLSDLQAGIKKYDVQGEHYLLPSGWDGNFADFLGLSWMPRYLVVDENGGIAVFNAVKANDKRILSALE
ncbi:TlpA disulfide reductase family protein [uncultured Tenacibaculum sp.]|uniref:TlpA family protein disulfide reductase n=1 Tax=uncultured Tenacibaculum sp. TaxID=174713 RepID=UPI00262C6C75|nr:TlpA disulfide reductase family protein [uncultured Tenacibaculum sp.]